MMPRAGFVLVLALAPAAAGQDRDVVHKPLLGTAPPELVADADWLNGPPVTLAALRGYVVWLRFNF